MLFRSAAFDIHALAGNISANGNVSANGFLNGANANVTGEVAAGSVLTNNLKGKSGYMSRVRSYTGVFQAQSGRKLVFCIMVNNSFAPNKRIKACIEQFLLHQYSIH